MIPGRHATSPTQNRFELNEVSISARLVVETGLQRRARCQAGPVDPCRARSSDQATVKPPAHCGGALLVQPRRGRAGGSLGPTDCGSSWPVVGLGRAAPNLITFADVLRTIAVPRRAELELNRRGVGDQRYRSAAGYCPKEQDVVSVEMGHTKRPPIANQTLRICVADISWSDMAAVVFDFEVETALPGAFARLPRVTRARDDMQYTYPQARDRAIATFIVEVVKVVRSG